MGVHVMQALASPLALWRAWFWCRCVCGLDDGQAAGGVQGGRGGVQEGRRGQGGANMAAEGGGWVGGWVGVLKTTEAAVQPRACPPEGCT